MEHTPLLKMYPSNPPIVRILYRFCLIKTGATYKYLKLLGTEYYFLVICAHKRFSLLGMESPLSRLRYCQSLASRAVEMSKQKARRSSSIARSFILPARLFVLQPVSPLSPSQFCSLQLRGSRRFLGVTSIQEQAPKICKLLQKALIERRNRLNQSQR